MAEAAFLDSNVLLYTLSADSAKADRAEALLSAGATISVQVLNEVAQVMRRKLHAPWEEVSQVLAVFRATLTVIPLDAATHEAGIGIAEATGYSIWDSMIVAAALGARTSILWSEDMADGHRIGDLVIRNPFAL